MTDALRKAAQAALDAMERYQVKRQDFDRFYDEVIALRAALAVPDDVMRDAERYLWLRSRIRGNEYRRWIPGAALAESCIARLDGY